MQTIVWTGTNFDEFDEFAEHSNFGYVVGSNFYNYKWYHNLVHSVTVKFPFFIYKRLPDWYPPDDPSVLEIFPSRDVDDDDESDWHWTTLRVGDSIDREGTVTRSTCD